jgi:hypothetical protein
MSHETAPSGDLTIRVIPAPLQRPAIRTVDDAMHWGGGPRGMLGMAGRLKSFLPGSDMRRKMEWQEANSENFERSLAAQAAVEDANRGGALAIVGHLWLAAIDRLGNRQDLGLAGCRVVTTTGVNFIVDAFQNLTEIENFKFHGVGTGTTAEASSQTALVTELTTQYSTSSTRPTGSQGEQSGNANVYETAATITVSASVALTEHGIFSQAATGGGVMLDRTLFSAVNLASGESLQATYDFSCVAGS